MFRSLVASPPSVRHRLLLEAAVWAAGLATLAATDPTQPGLFDACLFRWLGVPACPGCGLGHAVAYLFRGDWAASWAAHPLAAPAVAVLSARIFGLVRDAWRTPRPGPLS